ncbi:hypothetical protein [Magnetofaba australis]|nr:hypothetical protein [Magnetofaba australis]
MDWKQTLAAVAPALATALGGPLAGTAASMALSFLGLEPGEDPQAQLSAAVKSATPEQLFQLKQAEQAFTLEMERLGVDLQRIHAADRDSARKREMALKDHAPKMLALLIVLGFFSIQWWIATHALPEGARDLLLRTLGALDAALSMVLAYYFGSSAGQDRHLEGVASASASTREARSAGQ